MQLLGSKDELNSFIKYNTVPHRYVPISGHLICLKADCFKM